MALTVEPTVPSGRPIRKEDYAGPHAVTGTIPAAQLPDDIPTSKLIGTLPDVLLPNPLPAVSGAALTNLPSQLPASGSAFTFLRHGTPDTWTHPFGMIDVRSYGATGDGTTDDTTAVQAALTAAAGGTLYIPAGTYLISTTLLSPSNVRISGRGQLKAAATLGQFSPVLTLNGVTDVAIEGIEVHGNKAAYATATESRMGISVIGSSARITLRDLYLHDCKGDGLYIGSGDGSTYVEHVEAVNLRCDANHRQGLSITALRSGVFRNCWFTNTSGTAPQSGVDLEPNTATAVVEEVLFEGGGAYGNVGNGVQVFWPTTSTVQRNVTIRGFTSRNNTGHGFNIVQGKGVSIDGCFVYSNGDRGILVANNCRAISITRNRVFLNARQGIYVLAGATSQFITGLQIQDNRVYDNGSTAANTLDAIRIDWASGATGGCIGPVVTGNHCANQDTANQRYAITTDNSTKVIDLVLSHNYLKGTATGASVLNDDATTRRVRGNAGLADN